MKRNIKLDSLFFSVAMIILFPVAGVMADRMGLTAVFGYIGAAIMVLRVAVNIHAEDDKN